MGITWLWSVVHEWERRVHTNQCNSNQGITDAITMSDTNDFVCFEEELINLSFDLLSSVEYTQRKLGKNTTKIQKSDSHCETCCTFRWGAKVTRKETLVQCLRYAAQCNGYNAKVLALKVRLN